MRRVGLVLGAGGVAGQAFHAGVLGALEEVAGWRPGTAEVVVGTSAGSLVAALLRAGVPAAGLAAGAARAPGHPPAATSDAAEQALAGAAAAAGATGPAALRSGRSRLAARLAGLLPAGRLSTDGIARSVRATAGDGWPDRPTWICAVRRRDGQRTVFGSTGAPTAPLPLAVAASCAIPAYFAPVVIGDEAYVDGAAHSPTNLDLLAGRGLDLVVVSSPMSVSRGAAGRRLDTPTRLLFRAQLAREAFSVRRRGTPVLTLQPGAEDLEAAGLNALDSRSWSDVVRAARTSTTRRLQDPAVRSLLQRAV